MKLKKFLLRYYPPGILLEYIRNNGEVETKSIDLLNLSSEYACLEAGPTWTSWSRRSPPRSPSSPRARSRSSRRSSKVRPSPRRAHPQARGEEDPELPALQDPQGARPPPHQLLLQQERRQVTPAPRRFITRSYDRTCQVWDTETGNLLHKL